MAKLIISWHTWFSIDQIVQMNLNLTKQKKLTEIEILPPKKLW